MYQTLTFFFTDLVGSTHLWEEQPEIMELALARHDALLRGCIQQNRGVVVKSTGDGFLAIFEDPLDGMAAAVAGQRALTAEMWDASIGTLQARMALHMGIAEEREGDYYGTDVNRTARLTSAAHGGQILISEPIVQLCKANLPPGLALRDLGFHRLRDLSQEEHIYQLLAPDLPTVFPTLRVPDTSAINLPVQLTPFIGRAGELAELRSLLGRPDVALVTLTGPGGTGKTRLGLQVANSMAGKFPAGVTFVNLAPIHSPSLVPDAVARELDVIEQPDRSLIDSLCRYFEGKQALLILDSFEHVVAARSLITTLLARAPMLTILVTSREILHLRGEHEYAVPPLRPPDPSQPPRALLLSANEAIALFVERAQAAVPSFTLNEENAQAVAAICVRLDGLPLAIELAAARVRLFNPQQILARLDNRLRFLTGGARDLPSRQRTLRGAIDWSYHLLSEDEQRLFARLVAFTGGRSLEAVEAVCSPGLSIDVLEGLTSLFNKSLIARGEGPRGESRFYLLQTVREYATECLLNSGEAAQVQGWHLDYFVAMAEAMEPGYRQQGQLLLLERTAVELGNLRVAFDYAMSTRRLAEAARLVSAIDYYLRYRDRQVEGRRWFQRLLQEEDQLPQELLPRFLLGAGRLAWVNAALPQCHQLFLRGLEAARAARDRCVEAWLLVELGASASAVAGPELSWQRCQEGLAIFQALDDQPGLATAYNNLGEVARHSGDYIKARQMYEACLATCRRTGEIIREIMQSHNLAYVAYRQRDYARARDLNRSCLEQMVEINWKHGTIDTLWNLAGPLIWLGEAEKAARLLGASAAHLVEMGMVPHPGDVQELALFTADARARLDETTFAALFAEGQEMSLQEAIDYALE